MLRVAILSDLHLDRHDLNLRETDVNPDVVVLAGDISSSPNGVDWAAQTWRHARVLLVPGNNEYYNAVFQERQRELQSKARLYSNVEILSREAVEIDDVQFIGATLWTDLQLNGGDVSFLNNQPVKAYAGSTLWKDCISECFDITPSSFGNLARRPRRFTLEDSARLFKEDKTFIESKLTGSSAARKKVVVTHHLPSEKSIHPQYESSPHNALFASHLDALVAMSDVWIHGHAHHNCRYFIGKSEVICNPRGNPADGGGVENNDFDKHFFIEI